MKVGAKNLLRISFPFEKGKWRRQKIRKSVGDRHRHRHGHAANPANRSEHDLDGSSPISACGEGGERGGRKEGEPPPLSSTRTNGLLLLITTKVLLFFPTDPSSSCGALQNGPPSH